MDMCYVRIHLLYEGGGTDIIWRRSTLRITLDKKTHVLGLQGDFPFILKKEHTTGIHQSSVVNAEQRISRERQYAPLFPKSRHL